MHAGQLRLSCFTAVDEIKHAILQTEMRFNEMLEGDFLTSSTSPQVLTVLARSLAPI